MTRTKPKIIAAGAHFSFCRRYRYDLWRQWGYGEGSSREAGSQAKFCTFIGLNPSTADEKEDDPTIRRCISFAQEWGYDGLVMLNIFAFRATDPLAMKAVADPVGPENDKVILDRVTSPRNFYTVCAWGQHGAWRSRGWEVGKLLASNQLHCLGLTQDRRPRHPLYVRSSVVPVEYKP